MRYLARCFYSLLLLFALPAHAAPSRLEAQYDIFKSGLKVAVMHETFTRNQDRYRIESVTRPYGLFALFKHETIHVVSTGTITALGLRPQTFDYRREHDTDRNAHADFNWLTGKITLTDHAGTRTIPLHTGTQDRLSAMYQFMFLKLNRSTELKFDMTNGSKVDDARPAGNRSIRLVPDTVSCQPAASQRRAHRNMAGRETRQPAMQNGYHGGKRR